MSYRIPCKDDPERRFDYGEGIIFLQARQLFTYNGSVDSVLTVNDAISKRSPTLTPSTSIVPAKLVRMMRRPIGNGAGGEQSQI